MIRPATVDDIPRLLEFGEKFAAKANLAGSVGYDPASVERTMRYLIETELGICLIGESGAIGGLVHPHPFNLDMRVGQEYFWWSEGREGLALFNAVEAAAKALGCKQWTMICLEAVRPEATGRLLERKGYQPTEHHYIKEL
jgi:hypothetical protein